MEKNTFKFVNKGDDSGDLMGAHVGQLNIGGVAPPTTNQNPNIQPPSRPAGQAVENLFEAENIGARAGAAAGARVGQVNLGPPAAPPPAQTFLLPHEILALGDGSREVQWRALVDDLSQRGLFKNCLAISDVSGSMGDIPLKVSVALGLLLSELSEVPWKGRIFNYAPDPQLLVIQGSTLAEKKSFIESMPTPERTSFQKVCDEIFRLAYSQGLSQEKMVKKVYVFTDMDFDAASINNWETDYQAIQQKFNMFNYAGAVPQIVFWNLRGSGNLPVTGSRPGAALISGYTDNLMRLFMKQDGVVSV